MKLRIELRRVGMSRVSEECIPLMARVMSGRTYGVNLLDGDRLTDATYAKEVIQGRLNERVGRPVEIEWYDCTRENFADSDECGGLVERV